MRGALAETLRAGRPAAVALAARSASFASSARSTATPSALGEASRKGAASPISAFTRSSAPRVSVLASAGSAARKRKVRLERRRLAASGVVTSSNLPLSMRRTRSASSASERFDVVTIARMPVVSVRVRRMFLSSRRERGSTPTVGSSRKRSSGVARRLAVKPSFCFMPPESAPARRSSKPASPVSERSSEKRAGASALGTPRRAAKVSRFSRTVSSS